ncbi:hypothetical protein [Enterococcus phage vB_Efm3_KEN20]
MTYQELIEHKNTLQGKINEINKTIEYFKSIGVNNFIDTLDDTRERLTQLVDIIDTELYKKEELK